MKRSNWKHMIWSLLLCIFIPYFIPSNYSNEGIGNHTFGFPIKYITIHQKEPYSVWLFDNLFSGNDGMAINPATFLLNVLIIYLIIRFAANKMKKRKDVNLNVQ